MPRRSIDRFLKQSLKTAVANPKVILDIGARNGQEAQEFTEVFPKAQIYVFEARPEAAEQCRERLAKFENVHVFEGAVHEVHAGTVPFFPVTKSSKPCGENPGASSLYRANNNSYPEKLTQTEILVKTVRLDMWAVEQGITQIDLLWMDIEGAELLALRGMGKLLNTVRAVWIEVTFIERWEGHKGMLYPEVNACLTQHDLIQIKVWKVNRFFGDAVYVRYPLRKK